MDYTHNNIMMMIRDPVHESMQMWILLACPSGGQPGPGQCGGGDARDWPSDTAPNRDEGGRGGLGEGPWEVREGPIKALIGQLATTMNIIVTSHSSCSGILVTWL